MTLAVSGVPYHRCSSQFWSVSDPQLLVKYTLEVHAPTPEEETIPSFTLPSQQQQQQQEEDPNDGIWLCVCSTVEESEPVGVWASLTNPPAPSLPPPPPPPSQSVHLQAAYALLKVSEGFPIAEMLKTFRIPRHITATSHPPLPPPPPPLPPPATPPSPGGDPWSPCLQRHVAGLPTNDHAVWFELCCSDGRRWKGYHLRGESVHVCMYVCVCGPDAD